MRKKLFFILVCCLPGLGVGNELIANKLSPVASEEVPAQTDDAQTTWSDKAQEVLIQSLSLTGIRYKYGGNTPETGFDCSGFVRYVFHQAAQITLPPSARSISQLGKTVKKEELKPGDLVFFNTLKAAFSHVGIYMGDNKFIHAPRAGAQVRVESMNTTYWSSRFNGAKRIDNETRQ